MLTTYLGGDAGKRVLSGQISRGDGETIRAALVMADMRESTVLAETRRPRKAISRRSTSSSMPSLRRSTAAAGRS